MKLCKAFLSIVATAVLSFGSLASVTAETVNPADKELLVSELELGSPDKEKLIQETLETPGGSVVFYGAGLDKKQIYKKFFNGKQMPKVGITSADVDGKTATEPKYDIGSELMPDGKPVTAVENQKVQGYLMFYNYNGTIFTADGSYLMPKSVKNAKAKITAEQLENSIKQGDIRKQLKDFKAKVPELSKQKQPKSENAVSTFNTDAQLMTSIRIIQHYCDDSEYYDLDCFPIAQSTTDYLIYNAGDQDPEYDHLIVVAETQWAPTYDNRIIVGAVQGVFDNRYLEDTLITWQPDTGDITRQLADDQEMNFQIGYPWSVNVQWKWTSGATAEMQAQGDKIINQNYFNFINGTDPSRFYWIGSGENFTVKYSSMYKSYGTLLDLYVQSSVVKQWFNENEWEHHYYWEELVYDY